MNSNNNINIFNKYIDRYANKAFKRTKNNIYFLNYKGICEKMNIINAFYNNNFNICLNPNCINFIKDQLQCFYLEESKRFYYCLNKNDENINEYEYIIKNFYCDENDLELINVLSKYYTIKRINPEKIKSVIEYYSNINDNDPIDNSYIFFVKNHYKSNFKNITKEIVEKDFKKFFPIYFYERKIKTLKEGISIVEFLSEIIDYSNSTIGEIEDFIINCEIMISKETDNNRRKTFDFVKVDCITPLYRDNLNHREFIENHKRALLEYIIDKIANDIDFKSYNVSVNFLKLTSFVLTKSKHLNLIFELKDF